MRIGLKWFLIGSAVLAAAIGLAKRYYDDQQWLAAPAAAGGRASFNNAEYLRWEAEQRANQQRLDEALRGSNLQWIGYKLTRVTVTRNTDLNNLPLLEGATSLEEFSAESHVRLRDKDLLWAKNHPNLRRLSEIREISDRSLAIIGSCSKLESLEIQGSAITDDGLDHLRGLNHLEHLSLHGCPITGRGLAALSNLPRLSQLDIGCHLDEEGLKAIGQLKQLEQCTLYGGTFGRTGLRHLAGLPKLRTLNLVLPANSNSSGIPELDGVEVRIFHTPAPREP